MDTYYVDGKFLPANEATLPVNDLVVLRGYGVFDFLRTYNGIPFHLQEHISRLQRSARLIGLNMPVSAAELTTIVHETLQRNHHSECTLRLMVTGGVSSDNITPGSRPKLLVLVAKAKKMPASWYSAGIKVITTHLDRTMPGSKSINYVSGILSQREAADRNAVEALYVDSGGNIQEGTTSNFFALFGTTLVTPPGDRILPGVTRQVVLQLVKKEFRVEERDLHRDEIRLMDEAIITSSTREVVPVVKIDAIPLAHGSGPGPGSRRIMELFRHYTSNYGKNNR